MEILSPVWPEPGGGRPAPARPRALAGATIALVDDNLDIPFTTHLEALLGREHGEAVRHRAVAGRPPRRGRGRRERGGGGHRPLRLVHVGQCARRGCAGEAGDPYRDDRVG